MWTSRSTWRCTRAEAIREPRNRESGGCCGGKDRVLHVFPNALDRYNYPDYYCIAMTMPFMDCNDHDGADEDDGDD